MKEDLINYNREVWLILCKGEIKPFVIERE